MKPSPRIRSGSVLLVAMIGIALLSLVIAANYQSLIPRTRATHQSNRWQEAIHGAEAGLDVTITTLNRFAQSTRNPDAYPWTTMGWVLSDPAYALNGERTLGADRLPNLEGASHVRVTRLSVDVYTRNSAPPHIPWYRVRATARADLPGSIASADRRDGPLRRLKLSNRSAGAADPMVARTVEAVLKPVFRFGRAITTVSSLTLGQSSNWIVDSFDSADPNKSDPGSIAGGIYPASPQKRQSNGNIASAATLPAGTPYGPLIDANGATVAGDVVTNGGDNPSTASHENVTESQFIDQSRISDVFTDDIPTIQLPDGFAGMPNSALFDNFPSEGGTSAAPRRYVINGGLGAFNIAPPSAAASAYVEILIKGNLNIGSGNGAAIHIPPNVFASIYVDGNIDFNNGLVNSSGTDSRASTHLSIYGIHESGTYSASGNSIITAAIHAPGYDAELAGTVTSIGALISKTFATTRALGGGIGGFHYDEALGRGEISGWTVASYFEDARADL